MIRDLATLLAPASEQTFLEHFLDKRRLHVRAADPGRAISLLPWTEVNRLIQSDILPPERLRVIRANVDLLPAMYREGGPSQRLRPRALQALLAQGASVIINGISDLVPQISLLSDAVERRLGHRAWVNAYLSFSRGSALKAHWDGHDVLVLQVHGRKRWRSYGTPMPYPVTECNPGNNLGDAIVWDAILEPGDVLYLPRGEVHDAAVEGPNSAHLTIGIETLCGVDFLRWLAEQAARDAVARMDLTRIGGEAALSAHESLLKERLHAILDAVSVADYLGKEDQKRKPRPLLSIGLTGGLDTATMLVPTPRRHVPAPADGESGVRIGGESYQLSAAARRVLDLLLARNGLTFSELRTTLEPPLDEKTLRDAVADLASQGLVGMAPFSAIK